MFAHLILLLLPLALSTPAPHPEAAPDPFAIPLHLLSPGLSASPEADRRAVPLAHSETYVRRARDAALSKRAGARERERRGGRTMKWMGRLAGREPEPRDQNLEARLALDPTWLLKEAGKVDSKYNGGEGGFGELLALAKGQKRAGSVSYVQRVPVTRGSNIGCRWYGRS